MTTITLTVTSFNGQPGDGSLSTQFDELGGLIGRADTNQLVLPDPDRSISRVHAQVVFRNNRYAIIDRGSNPILVNGQAAGNDREMPLRDGDVVQIGGYELGVRLVDGAAARAASSDPFADLLGAPPAKPAAGAGAGLLDPLAAFGAAAQPPRAPAPAAPPANRALPAAAAGIPDDWNPFAPEPAAPAAGGFGGGFGAPQRGAGDRQNALGLDLGAAAPAALIPELAGSGSGGGNSDSLDALFGLKGQTGGDPFAQSALAQPMAQPNMSAHADPLKSLGSAARATGETQRDTLSDLNRPFLSTTPTAAAPSPLQAPAPAAAPAAPTAPAATANPLPPGLARPGTTAPGMAGGAVLSWDSEPGNSHTVIRPGGKTETGFGLGLGVDSASLPPVPVPAPTSPFSTDLDPFSGLGSTADSASPARVPTPAPLDFDDLFGTPAPEAAHALVHAPAPAPVTAPSFAPPVPMQAPAPAAAALPPSPAARPAASPADLAAARLAAAEAMTPGSITVNASRKTAAASAPSSTAETQALYDAFKEGLGNPELKFNTLTPDVMRLIGGLLQEAAAGTVEMLVARAALKRELRAESTMIKARENNPLKFSPTAEVALQHLLSPPARGFMAAAPAMRDAYTDLRAHQFGMVAGMRAALEGVLDRFDPAELEGRLTQRSVLHSLLPGSRKARLWEVFVEHFGQIREEASDDFHNLFGAAFLQAYNEHIDQIDRERP